MSKTFAMLVCTLSLAGCETLDSAWQSTKKTFTTPPAAASDVQPAARKVSAPNADSSAVVEITPVRSDQPLGSFKVENKSYADEDKDFGLPPVSSLYPVNYHGPTPTTLAGGTLISTYQLHKLLTTEPAPAAKPAKADKKAKKDNKAKAAKAAPAAPAKPILINVLWGDTTELIPGSIWLSKASSGGRMMDETETRLGEHLKTLTGGDLHRPLVFYCVGVNCWLSYNAALRAVNLGYRNVIWYRGGLQAWYAAGLPTTPSREDQW